MKLAILLLLPLSFSCASLCSSGDVAKASSEECKVWVSTKDDGLVCAED